MIGFDNHGSFQNTEAFLEKMSKRNIPQMLKRHGEAGVNALSNATPRETGITAKSWSYEITVKRGVYTIAWTNDHIEDGVPVPILLQYGHGTGTGGFVQGRDFINPAIRPIFDKIAADVWKEVTSA